ncbi:MAG: pilus assembly protein TadG-related protein [Rhizobiaceae bacterium]
MAGRNLVNVFSGLSLDRRGNFATMTALTAPVALAAAAIAIDTASLYSQRRETQGLADLAAITAAANLDRPELAAATVLRDNGVRNVVVVPMNTTPEYETAGVRPVFVSVVPGRYLADRNASATVRFVPGGVPVNAVKIAVRHEGTRHFSASFGEDPQIATLAIASVPAEAAFSVGSRLASLNGGIVNALLGGLTGTQISLSALDHQALLEADVELFGFLDALALNAGMTAATYDDVLDGEVTAGQVAAALGRTDGVDAAAGRVLRDIGQAIGIAGKPKLKLSRLLELGNAGTLALGNPPSDLDARLGVMQVLTGGAAIANGTNHLRLDLAANLPGVLAATIDLAVGEPMQSSPPVAVGAAGATVKTAQVRLLVSIEIGGPGGLLGTRIALPIYLEIARAEARLSSVTCTSGRPDSLRVGVAARPGVLDARIATVDAARLSDFSGDPAFSQARILTAPLVSVAGQAHVAMENQTATTLTFDRDDIDRGTIRTVATRNFTQSLTQSLLGNLSLTVNVAGLGIGVPSNLASTVSNLLSAATPAIDVLLASVLSTLGIRIGEADVRVHGAICGRPVLVQ